MSTVSELAPGDLVVNGEMSAVFIASTPHPLYPDLALVIWRLYDQSEQWSHDALRWTQDVGQIQPPVDRATRQQRLREALLDRSQWWHMMR